jgi:methylmalonyl-CoA mutase cobalamin-binding domain/chain
MNNDSVEIQNQLLDHMLSADRKGAIALVDSWALNHTYEQAVNELLEPVLRKFGDIWNSSEDVNLAQGYISAKVAEDIMLKAANSRSPQNEKTSLKGPVVIGNIEDDYHSLGRKLVSTFLKADGWQVIDLGNDTLPKTFIKTALDYNAKVVGASAMMYVNAMNIKKLRAEIDQQGLNGKIQLAVGGAVFNLRPELAAEVGADGTASNALAASPLMTELWEKAEAAGGEA